MMDSLGPRIAGTDLHCVQTQSERFFLSQNINIKKFEHIERDEVESQSVDQNGPENSCQLAKC